MNTRGGHTLTTTQDLATMSLTASCSCGWEKRAYIGGFHAPLDVVGAWEAHLAEAAALEPVKHTLGPAAVGTDRVVTVACSCGEWGNRWEEGLNAPGWLDVEAAHRAHADGAPARVSPPQFPPAPNPAMDAIISAALAMAKAGEHAAKALEEFTDAHAAARRNGVGVLVVRRPDGTIASTPNVYLAPGVVLYTDDPGSPWQTTPAPFVDAAAPFVARAPFESEWAPRYTAAPPLNLPNAA